MSYRPTLTGRALAQFNDIKDDKVIYDAFMEKVLWLIDAPWDAWPVYRTGVSQSSGRPSSASTDSCRSASTITLRS